MHNIFEGGYSMQRLLQYFKITSAIADFKYLIGTDSNRFVQYFNKSL